MFLVSVFLHQCTVMTVYQNARSRAGLAAVGWFSALPPAVPVLAAGTVLAWSMLTLRALRRGEERRITPMSVKEAMDSLSAGVCAYLPGGRILLMNRAMERFCLEAVGSLPVSGEALARQLLEGPLLPGCTRAMAGEMPVILLPDGSARAVAEAEAPFRRTSVRRLLLSDVTEAYRKTLSLQEMHRNLASLNARLNGYNREIVALTAEKELLDARVRLHDRMGEDLLTMKRCLSREVTQEERLEVESMLRRNVAFLKTGQKQAQRDEYELILETAEKLGVHVTVEGELPGTEPQKHVLATAIHECFTNTLRHAHGDAIRVAVSREDGSIRAVLTNNGVLPDGPVQEKGGLSTLRALAERAGGSMTVTGGPAFSVVLILPMEVPYALQSTDCR